MHPLKAFLFIDFTEDGIVTSDKDEHLLKINASIVVIDDGIAIWLNDSHL